MLDSECLRDVLRLRGFRQRWQLWIDLWLHSAKVQVLLNGVVGKGIVYKRSLWPGDPLSPLLFVLATGWLNRTFENAKTAGLIH